MGPEWMLPVLRAARGLQYVGVAAGLIGCAFSVYALGNALRTRREMVRAGVNSYRLHGAHLVIATHRLVLAAQVLVAITSTVILTMPDVPASMYASPQAPWTMGVILFRRVTLLSVTLILVAVGAVWVRWLATMPRGTA